MNDKLWQLGDIVYAPAMRMYTEREKVLAEREAYECGMIRGTAREFDGLGGGMPALKVAVAKAFPLPKVKRPRRAVLHTPAGKMIVFVRSGILFDGPTEEPVRPVDPLWLGPEGLRELADLLDRPTEEVDADG